MSLYYPHRKPDIAPYHAREAMPLFEIKRWIEDAEEGQSFIVLDGQMKTLPVPLRFWLEVWEDEGFITYEAVMDWEIATKRNPRGYRVHVTRTGKKL